MRLSILTLAALMTLGIVSPAKAESHEAGRRKDNLTSISVLFGRRRHSNHHRRKIHHHNYRKQRYHHNVHHENRDGEIVKQRRRIWRREGWKRKGFINIYQPHHR